MFYVYVLKSRKKDWWYIGYTSDLRKRLVRHQGGASRATKPYKPFDLIFYEAYKAKADAKRREEYLKSSKGKRALRLLLRESLRDF